MGVCVCVCVCVCERERGRGGERELAPGREKILGREIRTGWGREGGRETSELETDRQTDRVLL